MLWAFAATGRLNCVVSFQASTLTSMMLLISASRGARGKEATNRVMKPNWITGTQRGERLVTDGRMETAPSADSKRTLHLSNLPTHLSSTMLQNFNRKFVLGLL